MAFKTETRGTKSKNPAGLWRTKFKNKQFPVEYANDVKVNNYLYNNR